VLSASLEFTIYALLVDESIAMPAGHTPTLNVLITSFFAVSIIDKVLFPAFDTMRRLDAAVT
jgi:hypothetical protein